MRNNRRFTSPLWAKKLLTVFVRSGNRQYLIGDLEEHYSKIAADRGKLFAFFWFWYQTLRPAPDFMMTNTMFYL